MCVCLNGEDHCVAVVSSAMGSVLIKGNASVTVRPDGSVLTVITNALRIANIALSLLTTAQNAITENRPIAPVSMKHFKENPFFSMNVHYLNQCSCFLCTYASEKFKITYENFFLILDVKLYISEETMTMMMASSGGIILLVLIAICIIIVIRKLCSNSTRDTYGIIDDQNIELEPMHQPNPYSDLECPQYINDSHRVSVDEFILTVHHKKLNNSFQREFKVLIKS